MSRKGSEEIDASRTSLLGNPSFSSSSRRTRDENENEKVDETEMDENSIVDRKSNKKGKSKELKKGKIIDKVASNEIDLEEGFEKNIVKTGNFSDLKGKELKAKHSKGKLTEKSKSVSSVPVVERRVYDESDDLLSEYTSDTTFFDGEASTSSAGMSC
jgi:hypothetical protein